MPSINVLPREVAELIAAGEVVERPASVIKEMVENCIDASATHITVEIQRGGITYMRVTDDGCGISHTDVPLAFLRHATSKIKSGEDLEKIGTLGFRGEALAATSSVSKIELYSKTADEDFGTHYIIEGGVEVLYEESGCENGTTIIVRDLFYNTPARMKFLKKDVTEANSVAAVVERAALSHPEISFRLIRDGKPTLTTPGDGKLKSAIYCVLGREFSASLIEIKGEGTATDVSGFICKPVSCRPSRAGQFVFLNGRLVRSGTVTAAVEQAYKNSAMVGKFPAFVLNITLPLDTVDVNVHPAKTEVRFADEKQVFNTVYYAVKNALTAGDTRPVINMAAKKPTVEHMTSAQYRQQGMNLPETVAERAYSSVIPKANTLKSDNKPYFMREDVKRETEQAKPVAPAPTEIKRVDIDKLIDEKPEPRAEVIEEVIPVTPEKAEEREYRPETEVRFIGEAFSTYIIVEQKNSIFLIDKHAAHERILYNKLKATQTVDVQSLLAPVSVRLSQNEYDAVLNNTDLLEKAGFEVEDFGNSTVIVRTVPSTLIGCDIASVISEAAEQLGIKGIVEIEALDHIYHTVACKAAIKAGGINSQRELCELAKTVLSNDDIRYCPHGRPVAFEIKKSDLEKQFGRIQ